MFKVEKTERIKAIMKATLGEKAQLEKYSVYECISNDSEAIKNTWGIYKNSEMSESFLQQMAKKATSTMVPLIELHNTYGKLPVGRIIDAAVFNNDLGGHDLHVLFFVQSSDKEDSLDQKLSSGIVNSFSSSTSPKKLNCKTCGFDFTASEKTLDAMYYDKECGNGHKIGKDTVVQLTELDEWSELSLVVQGAVPRARLLSVENQKLASKIGNLNLSGNQTLGKLQLNTGLVSQPDKPEPKPNFKPPVDDTNMSEIKLELSKYNELIKLEGSNENLTLKLNALETEKNTLLADKAKLQTEKDNLEAEKVTLTAEKDTLQTEKTGLEAEVISLKAQLAASGVPEGGKSNNPMGDVEEVDGVNLSFYKG